MDPSGQPVVELLAASGLFHKGTNMGEVILMAQLTQEFHLFLFFFPPSALFAGFCLF